MANATSKSKNTKPNWFRRVGAKFKETFSELKRVTDVATEAGRILLKNGAEIFRVEETMSRICKSFGVEVVDVFTLSHALFVSTEKDGISYTRVRAVPLAGAHLGAVAEVNNLSRGIVEGRVGLEQAKETLSEIDKMRPVKDIYQIIGAGTTSISFGALLGSGLAECICAFVIGCLVWCWVLAAQKMHVTKMIINLFGGMILTALSILAMAIIPVPMKIDGMIIGAIMPLIPGITCVNAIRDIADGDFLCGTVRMLDALFVFVYIAAGVGVVLGICNGVSGGMGL